MHIPLSHAQCRMWTQVSWLKGTGGELAEILSRAHVLRPDHIYPRCGRAATPGLCQGHNLMCSSEHLIESQLSTGGFHLQTGEVGRLLGGH